MKSLKCIKVVITKTSLDKGLFHASWPIKAGYTPIKSEGYTSEEFAKVNSRICPRIAGRAKRRVTEHKALWRGLQDMALRHEKWSFCHMQLRSLKQMCSALLLIQMALGCGSMEEPFLQYAVSWWEILQERKHTAAPSCLRLQASNLQSALLTLRNCPQVG